MTTLTARVTASLAAFAAALFVSACTSPASDGHTDHEHGQEASAATEPAADAKTGAGADARADFNDADVTFANDMIPHHEQAVEMSALVPDRSSDPSVVELAAAISNAQEPEIATMKGFLTQWKGGEGDSSHEGHDMGAMNMPGMVDGDTMTKLESLEGKDFDTLWLQSMIAHHDGAIGMANTEIADGANADAKKLAGQIVEAQKSEVAQMKSMLGA